MANYVNVYTKKDIYFNGEKWVSRENKLPVTGIKKEFYGDGSLQDETPLTDGLNNGVQKVYDPKGNVWYENTWKNNVMIKFNKVS